MSDPSRKPYAVGRLLTVGGLLAVGTTLLFVGLTHHWATTAPVAAETDPEEARARVAEARVELPEVCPRAVLRGVALPGDGAEGLRALADAESACLTVVASNGAWSGVTGARVASAAPLPLESQVVAECAGLDAAVQALLQRESGCTAEPLFLDGDRPDIRGLADALITLARGPVREGRIQEGAELLLDVIRLGQDFTRGPASFVPVGVGQQVQTSAVLELEALLASDLPWTGAMLDELARQAQVLIATMPDPLLWFEYNAIWDRQHALDVLAVPDDEESSEEALVDLAAAEYGDTHWPACTTLETCAARYREAVAALPRASDRHSAIPRIEREANVEAAYERRLRRREAALSVATLNQALLRTLPALFLHRRTSLSGTCPSAQSFQAEARVAGLGERFEVTASNQSPHPLHLHATGDATYLRVYCPALGAEVAGGLP